MLYSVPMESVGTFLKTPTPSKTCTHVTTFLSNIYIVPFKQECTKRSKKEGGEKMEKKTDKK